MARVKFSPIVTDISGSVGGLTFQRNKFGNTLRSKPLPLHSETPAQYNIRQKITSIQQAWQALTDAQRLQWDRFIDFSGQSINADRAIKLSGHALYLKYQLFRLLYNQALLTTIVYIPMPDYFILEEINRTEEALYLNFTGSIVSTSYFFICKLTSPRLQTQAYNSRGQRFMSTTIATADNFTIHPAYVSAFGALPATLSWVHYSIRYFSLIAPVYSGVFTGRLQVFDRP